MKTGEDGPATIHAARDVLRKYWGHHDFRPGQDAAISAVLAGSDTLTVMPTGGGKSLCYQVPAMLLPGITLVVSPLISLMKDQVDALGRAGVPATLINSTLSSGEQMARLEAAERGAFKLMYVAPERFDAEGFAARLARLRVSLLAVDEAHCVSEWGHDFRPSYLRLARVRGLIGNPPVAALTATATPEVRRDIVRQLDLRDAETLITGFDRRNLIWHVLRAKNDSEKDRLLLRLLRSKEGSAIVYASTRKSVDAITALLAGVGIGVVGYHAGLGDADRRRVQEAWMSGESRVVVATNAFGMGIDKADVRLVVHYNMPGNLEAYYQEAGRAGRDGQPAECILLHAYADRFTHEFFIEQSHPPREVVEEVMRSLRAASDSDGALPVPFGEFAGSLSSIKGDRQAYSALRILTDHGLARQAGSGGSEAARIRLIATPKRIQRELDTGDRNDELHFLRALWRTVGGDALQRGTELEWRILARLGGGRNRAGEILDQLRGEAFLDWQPAGGEGVSVVDRTTAVRSLPIDWRAVESRKNREVRKLKQVQGYAYHEACRRAYVLRYFGDSAVVDECGACDNCLGITPVPTEGPPRQRRERKGSAPPPEGVGSSDPREDALFERLRTVRATLARDAGVPAYCVFPDRTLREMARRRPDRDADFLDIAGVGAAKLERYASAFRQAIRDA